MRTVNNVFLLHMKNRMYDENSVAAERRYCCKMEVR